MYNTAISYSLPIYTSMYCKTIGRQLIIAVYMPYKIWPLYNNRMTMKRQLMKHCTKMYFIKINSSPQTFFLSTSHTFGIQSLHDFHDSVPINNSVDIETKINNMNMYVGLYLLTGIPYLPQICLHVARQPFKEFEVRNSFLIMAFTVAKSGSATRLFRFILFNCSFNHVKLHEPVISLVYYLLLPLTGLGGVGGGSSLSPLNINLHPYS